MATSKIEKVTNNSGSGYCKMPDGTLIQYGHKNNASDGQEIQFAIEFSSVDSVQITPQYNSVSTARCVFSISGLTTKKFVAYAFDTDERTGSTSTTLVFNWLAIGRWK